MGGIPASAPPRDHAERGTSAGARRRGQIRSKRKLLYVLGGSVALGAVAAIGLRFEPGPLPVLESQARPVTATPVPDGLPEPVDRFYRTLYGDEVPVVETAVISGRGRLRIAGITMPARYRFSHVAGHDYRHDIETTIFGRRLLAVDERYVDGSARLELPVGVSEGPQVDQGANLALWAEAIWMPALWVTDPRVRWEEVDASTARLIVPFGEETETFKVSFDRETGLLVRMESMRFREEGAATRTLWINEVLEWGEVDRRPVPLRAAVTWGDEGSPWAVFRTESVVYNADLRIDRSVP